ncbi:MAG: hypothetical protein JW909_03115 [Planctomycetes bacterium]|nr:hypothetical protein [Planctomycetota bacterium]
MRILVVVLVVSCFMLGVRVHGGEAPEHVLSRFDSADELSKWSGGDSGNVKVSVEPRTPTDKNKMLKMECMGGAYPGITTTPPADWTPYEVLSFVVWAPSAVDVLIRIDDVHSRNYTTRYNHGIKVEKGRTLIQIPVKDIGKSIDVGKVKMLILFTSSPPKGLVLWFDDIQLGPMQSDRVDFIPYKERMDIIPSMEVETPHLPFGRKLAGGPLRALMIAGAENGRESVEMLQRLDMDLSLVTWDRNWRRDTWGFGDFYGDRTQDSNYVLLQKYVASSVQGPEKFEVMILPTPLGWNRFSLGTRESIVERVKERGEGLVLVFPYTGDTAWAWPEDLKGLSPLIDGESDYLGSGGTPRYARNGRLFDRKWRATGEHPVTRGVPVEGLPFNNMEVQKYEVAEGAEVLIETDRGEPVLAVKTAGKGRVAAFAVRSNMITPLYNIQRDISTPVDYRYWEISYDLLARAAMWAGKREFRRDGAPTPLVVEGENEDKCLAVRQWKDGEGKVTDWEMAFVPLAKPAAITVTAPESIRPGEEIRAQLEFPAGREFAKCTVCLYEKAFGRVRTIESMEVETAKLPVEDGKPTVRLPSERVRQYVAYVKASSGDESGTAEGTAEVVVTPPPAWDDYEIYTWLDYGLPFLRDFEEGRMREFGITANLIGAGDHRSMKRQFKAGLRVVAYGFTGGMHIRDFSEVVRQYQLTGDKKYLVRQPSYNDDAFLEEERRKTAATCAGVGAYAPISMIMSDETSLTSYSNEFDYDFHPGNIEKFRAKLKRKFGTVEAMNAALGSESASFSAVEPPTTEEARESGNWGLWNEWRSHNDDQWALAFKFYGDTMKENYREARLSVSGTQTSHVFNGIDWGKMTRYFDAMSDYGGRFQLRKRLSFKPEGLKSTPWVGYGRSGRAVDHQLWTNLSFEGDGAAIFWWYSLRNPDLTWCRSAKDYMRVFKELRGGIGRQFQLMKRKFSPVGVCWSANSQRAAWTQGKYGEFEKSESTVVKGLVEAGFDPFFITEEEIAEGGLEKRGAKALVLPMTVSLGISGKKGGLGIGEKLKSFVDGGGLVFATHRVEFDEFLQPAVLPEDIAGRISGWPAAVDALESALAGRGVGPYASIRTPAGERVRKMSASLHTFPGNDSARVILLLREPVGMKQEIGADGVIYMVPDPTGGEEIEKIEVDVSAFGAAKFYNVRTGREMKPSRGRLAVDMQAGDGLPIAVLDYGPAAFVAGTEVSVAERTLGIRWRLSGSGGAPLGRHVVRIEVIDSGTGEIDPALSMNATSREDGSGSVDIPLAEEDRDRVFVVRLKDVLSGAVWKYPKDAAGAVQPVEGGPAVEHGGAASGAGEPRHRGPVTTDGPQARRVAPSSTAIGIGAAILVVVVLLLAAASRGGKKKKKPR